MYKYKLKKLLFLLITLIAVGPYTTVKASDIEKYIGLYEIINSDCNIDNNDYNPCKYILFFELLKGEFTGVKDNELAYVLWSGDPKIDAELDYASHRIRNHQSSKIYDGRFLLNSDSESQEYLIFSEGKLIGYNVIYGVADKTKPRVIHYKLKPVQRGDLPDIHMNYPENK